MSYHDERMSGSDAATVIHNYDEYEEPDTSFVKKVWIVNRITTKDSREYFHAMCLGTGLVMLGLTFGLFWALFMPIVGSYILSRAKLVNYQLARRAGIYGAAIAIGWIIYLRWFI